MWGNWDTKCIVLALRWEVCNEPCRSASPGLVSDFDLIFWPGAWVTYQGLPVEEASWWQKGRTSPLSWQGDPPRSILPQKLPVVWDNDFCGETLVLMNFSCWKNIGQKCFENCLTFSKWQSFNVFRSNCCFILIASINWRLKKMLEPKWNSWKWVETKCSLPLFLPQHSYFGGNCEIFLIYYVFYFLVSLK